MSNNFTLPPKPQSSEIRNPTLGKVTDLPQPLLRELILLVGDFWQVNQLPRLDVEKLFCQQVNQQNRFFSQSS